MAMEREVSSILRAPSLPIIHDSLIKTLDLVFYWSFLIYIFVLEIEASPPLQEFGVDCAFHYETRITLGGLSKLST